MWTRFTLSVLFSSTLFCSACTAPRSEQSVIVHPGAYVGGSIYQQIEAHGGDLSIPFNLTIPSDVLASAAGLPPLDSALSTADLVGLRNSAQEMPSGGRAEYLAGINYCGSVIEKGGTCVAGEK
jgi:hypothetical protein